MDLKRSPGVYVEWDLPNGDGLIGLLGNSYGDNDALVRGIKTLEKYIPGAMFFLGDLLEDGQKQSENQCINFLRDSHKHLGVMFIKGNTEFRIAASLWNRLDIFSPDNISWIERGWSAIYMHRPAALMVHSLSADYDNMLDDHAILEAFVYWKTPAIPKHPETGFPKLKRIMHSHTHIPLINRIDPNSQKIERLIPGTNVPIKLEKEYEYSVGIPTLNNKHIPEQDIPKDLDPDLLQAVCVYEPANDEIIYVPINQNFDTSVSK